MSDRENPVLAWVRPRKWSILAEAVLALAVALAGWPILVFGGEAITGGDEAVEAVTGYLEALRDGDLDAANDYSGGGGLDGADGTLLTAEALSSDWEIESVERRSASTSAVHAVIRAGERRAEGVFHVEETDDGMRITDPYVTLTVRTRVIETLSLSGHELPIEMPEDGSALQLSMYPGAYVLFEDAPGFADDPDAILMAMPSGSALALEPVLAGAMVGNAEVEERLNTDLAGWIDLCAESTEAAPPGCPFGAASDYGAADDGVDEFEEVSKLTWAVDGHPRVRLTPSLLVLETVEPGWMSLSGSGLTWHYLEEAELRGRCRVSVVDIVPVMLPNGGFKFSTNERDGAWNTCYRGLTW